MASVTIILKENKANEKGEMPIYIRLIKGRKAKFISLGIKVHPNQWNSEKLRVKSQFTNSARVNAYIAKKVAEAENTALTLEMKEKHVSSRKIKEAIIGKEQKSFLKYGEQYISELKAKGKIGTHNRVKAVFEKLKKFIKKEDLNFDDFDLQFLKRYDAYLREDLKNSQNTIHANLKVFRRLFNNAVREELIEANIDPFRKFKMSTEKTKKQYLTEDELNAIEKLPLKENIAMYHHRNMYVLAAYAGGIRISDLLQLRWLNFDESHLNIFTQKTKETVSIKLPTKALEIIDYYSLLQPDHKPTDFIFPFLKNNLDYSDPKLLFNAISSNTAFANKNLKFITEKAGIEKHLSFHTSRHTWATRALKKGVRIEYVSKLMGHTNIKTTQIYAQIVSTELDNAMDVFN